MSLFVYSYSSPFGVLRLVGNETTLTQIAFPNQSVPENVLVGETLLLLNAAQQLNAYFEGTIQSFYLPLQPFGTPFQQTVWDALQKIPYGHTVSYKEVAAQLGKPAAARAVGFANARNPIPILIPCHRVIAADGSLGGYSFGLDVKQKLLELEGIVLPSKKQTLLP